MAARLTQIFDQARALGGPQGVVKLAILTKMSSQTASTAPDSPENVKLFVEAFAKLKLQLGK